MYFEDFPIDSVTVSIGRTITESDTMDFARLTGDFSGLHTDETRAKQSAFGGRIAHGALVFGISIGLAVRSGLLDESLIAFYGVDGLRFVRPVHIGDTVTVQKRVEALAPKGPGRGLVTFHTRVLNQHGHLVLIYRDSLLLKTRSVPDPIADGDPAPTL